MGSGASVSLTAGRGTPAGRHSPHTPLPTQPHSTRGVPENSKTPTVDKVVTDLLEILGLERSGMSQKSHQKVGQNKALIPGKTVTFEYSFRCRSRTGFSLFRYHFIILHFTFEKQTYFH